MIEYQVIKTLYTLIYFCSSECADSSTAAIAAYCSTLSRNTSRVPSHTRSPLSPLLLILLGAVLRIRYILIRIRIHGSKPMFLREEDK
jgi:hypothetical protein